MKCSLSSFFNHYTLQKLAAGNKQLQEIATLFENFFDAFNNRRITDICAEKIKGMFCAENLLLDHITELAPVRPTAAFFLRLLDS